MGKSHESPRMPGPAFTRVKSLILAITASAAFQLVTAVSVMAGGITDEQEKFLGYLGQAWCVMERDNLGSNHLSRKIKLYVGIKGFDESRWTEFATRLESLFVAEQIAKAMLPSGCSSIDFKSQYWKNASDVMDRMSSINYGTPTPPKAGQEEAWIRKWCSIGWRNYGEEHMDRCIKLIDKQEY